MHNEEFPGNSNHSSLGSLLYEWRLHYQYPEEATILIVQLSHSLDRVVASG